MSHKLQMYENLQDMLEREGSEIEHKKDLDRESLDNLYKLMMSIKAVNKCLDKEEGMSMDMRGRSMDGGYSGRYTNDYSGNSYEGTSYARGGRDGDGDGRYGESRDNFRGYTNRGYDYSRESRGSGRDRMVSKLHELMNEAGDEQSRMLIQSCIDKM
jgi:hypothetical protein